MNRHRRRRLVRRAIDANRRGKVLERKTALTKIDGMRCDFHAGAIIVCQNNVTRAPRLYVPSMTQDAPGHDPVRLMSVLHYCEEHVGTLKLDDYLTDQVKWMVEQVAKKTRPVDWKPNFEAAYLHYVDIFSREYKRFLEILEIGNVGEISERIGGLIAH